MNKTEKLSQPVCEESSYLSNHQIQDILEDMGMLEEDGTCPYYAEEIFRAGVEWAIKNKQNIKQTKDE